MMLFLFSAARLAWRQIFFDKPRMLAAILGVTFACVLIFMQLGFRDSLRISTELAPQAMQGDLFVVHKQTEAMWRSTQFQKSILARALGHPDVASVHPVYISLSFFKNMDTRLFRTLMVYGIDPDADLMGIPQVIAQKDIIKLKDHVLFDRSSRPEFGSVEQQVRQGRVYTEINNYKVKISGFFVLGTTFAVDGNVITSEENFLRIVPNRTYETVDIGIIRLNNKSNLEKVRNELQNSLLKDVLVLTRQEFLELERNYWEQTAPVGFIFGLGVIMGLIIGMVIVYQILFTNISNNIVQFATLKAMGYTQSYLLVAVFSLAAYLAVLGFMPGLLISLELYETAEKNIFIQFPMPVEKVVMVFSLILCMCFAAGVLAIRKLRYANTAEMF